MGVDQLHLVLVTLGDTGDHVGDHGLDSSETSDVLSVSVPNGEPGLGTLGTLDLRIQMSDGNSPKQIEHSGRSNKVAEGESGEAYSVQVEGAGGTRRPDSWSFRNEILVHRFCSTIFAALNPFFHFSLHFTVPKSYPPLPCMSSSAFPAYSQANCHPNGIQSVAPRALPL